MKYTYLLIAILTLFGTDQLEGAQPEEKITEIKAAYAPVGFDNNDQVQVVVAGTLPDSCHKVGPTRVETDEKNKTITLTQILYDYSQSSNLCMDVITPFTQTVDVGILSTVQDYTILGKTKNDTKKLGALSITRAPHTEKVDENLYMPVSNAHIKRDAKKGRVSVVLEGEFSNRCMAFSHPDVKPYPRNHVLVVLPLMKSLVKEGERCVSTENDLKRFSVEIPIKDVLFGTYLIHIRAYQGKAINLFETFGKVRIDP